MALEVRIGEVALEWAATAIAIPGGDGHPLFPAVAAWAAWGATAGGDFERAEDLLAIAQRAQTALGTRLPCIPHGRGILALFRSDFEAARGHATEWTELARVSGDAYELAHALILLGVALQFGEPTIDAAIATFEEAVQVARSAGIDVALVVALENLAGALPIEETERALALLDEALDISTRIGYRYGVASAMSYTARLAARRGDWPTALQGTVVSAETNLEFGRGQWSMSEPFHLAGVALCALGSYEPAAVLLGYANELTDSWGLQDWMLESKAAADAALVGALGEHQVATLAAKGAALETRDAVTLLRAEADRAYAEL
jgi:tetratricopeptide (TPR) repeat protein